MAALTLKNLTKRFGTFRAVNDVSLSVEDGEFICLLGPSGCGKTTILRTIAGLIEPDAGDVLFDNTSVLDVPPERRQAAMVFQNYVLFPHMTVSENVGFGLKMRGKPKSEIAERVERLLELVHLKEFGARRPSQLSGGQQQRVALARALVTEPDLLLMDEPLANLDTKLRIEMRAFLTALHNELPVTTLFVTHDQEEALMLAQRIGVLFDGVLHQFDTPIKIFNEPANRRVADFIGSANLIAARASTINGGTAVLDTVIGSFAVGCRGDLAAGQALTVSLRPQHIKFLDHGLTPNHNSFEAVLTEAVFLGGTVQYRVQCAGKALTVISTSEQVHGKGETVRLYIAPENVWYLLKED